MSHDTFNALTFADLLEQIGNVDPKRIRLRPPPGKATERDILRIYQREHRRYELVDGVLVEKVMGFQEAFLATWLGHLLQSFLDQKDLGVLVGADGAVRLMPRLVRIPDLSFVRWDKLPGRTLPEEPIPDLAPDLAVEVLSKSNTPSEMARKLRDYFKAGVRLMWFLDPKKRSAEVYTAPTVKVTLTEADTLDGGNVLPGLSLPLRRVFERLPRKATTSRPAKGKRKKRPPRN
jgi:Uma2 family endonuclease